MTDTISQCINLPGHSPTTPTGSDHEIRDLGYNDPVSTGLRRRHLPRSDPRIAIPDELISKSQFSPRIIPIFADAVIAGFTTAIHPTRKASTMNVLDAITTE